MKLKRLWKIIIIIIIINNNNNNKFSIKFDQSTIMRSSVCDIKQKKVIMVCTEVH